MRRATTSRASPRSRAGLPPTTAGLTVNRFCASGLQAIAQAAHMVSAEGADAVIGGGVESISMVTRDNSPNPAVQEQLSRRLHGDGRDGRSGSEAIRRRPRRAGRIRRSISQQRTAAHKRKDSSPASSRRSWRDPRQESGEKSARNLCRRTNAIVPRRRSRPHQAAAGVRHDQRAGSVTAGNSSQLSDGASATLVMSSERAKALGLDAAARVPRLRRLRLRAGRDGHRSGVRRAEAAETGRRARRRTSTSGS